METAVMTSLIAGVFSLATALGSVRVPGLALARQVRHLSYQLEVFSLWAAFLAGWSLIHRSVWSDAVFSFGMGWLACAVVGGVVVAFRRRGAA
jgi:hypothetical protein